jgi:hypothetical protein
MSKISLKSSARKYTHGTGPKGSDVVGDIYVSKASDGYRYSLHLGNDVILGGSFMTKPWPNAGLAVIAGKKRLAGLNTIAADIASELD